MSIFEITSEFIYCQNVIVGLGTAGNAFVEQMHQANISDAHFVCLSQDESSINESSTYTWIEFDHLDSGLEQETSGF